MVVLVNILLGNIMIKKYNTPSVVVVVVVEVVVGFGVVVVMVVVVLVVVLVVVVAVVVIVVVMVVPVAVTSCPPLRNTKNSANSSGSMFGSMVFGMICGDPSNP